MAGGRSGAVNFIQRFDSALRLNVHFHALVLDGVFVESRNRSRPLWGTRHGEPVFCRLPARTVASAALPGFETELSTIF